MDQNTFEYLLGKLDYLLHKNKKIHEIEGWRKAPPDELDKSAINAEHRKYLEAFNEGEITYGELVENATMIGDKRIEILSQAIKNLDEHEFEKMKEIIVMKGVEEGMGIVMDFLEKKYNPFNQWESYISYYNIIGGIIHGEIQSLRKI